MRFLFQYKNKQVNRCSSAGASNKSRQTKIAHALAKSFQGFKHKLFCLTGFGFVTFFARCTCFRHGSLFCPSSNFIRFAFLMLHYTSFALLLRFIPHNSATLISATFSTPATNFSARLHSRSGCVQWALIFSNAKAKPKNKPTHCPCVAIVWHKLR